MLIPDVIDGDTTVEYRRFSASWIKIDAAVSVELQFGQ
jgi:hypothetical protein